MYPTLYHAFYDLLGVDWPALRLLNSFGFFVALAFIAASVTLSWELKRRAKLGLFTAQKQTVVTGQAPNWVDISINASIGFIIGWKFIFLMKNSDRFFENGDTPQQHIFSGEGYWLLGLILAVAFGAWRWYEYRRHQKPQPIVEEIPLYPHHLNGNITFVAAIFGILGAKLFHLLENPDEFRSFFEHPSFQDFVGGLTVYGGLIVGAAGVLFYAWRKKINLWHLMDSAAPGLILAYGIGRIGCQVSGDGDWGIANSAPKPGWLSWAPDWFWAYDYPNNVNAVTGPSADTFGRMITEPGVPCFDGYCTHLVPAVFPTPVYETIAAVGIFILLWSLRKRIVIPGVIMSFYLMLNGIERFLIEKIRVNEKFDLLGMKITQAEVISVLFFITGIVMLFYVRKRFGKGVKLLINNK